MMLPIWEECLAAPDKLDLSRTRELLLAAIEKCFPSSSFDALKKNVDPIRLSRLIGSLLEEHHGSWVTGWCLSVSDGGLVEAWCCPEHSIFAPRDRSLDKTIDRVLKAIKEWHSLLHYFPPLFESLHQTDDSLESAIEHAAVVITKEILQISDGDDAWYHSFQMVFGWYLESLGFESIEIEEQVEAVVEGKFSSWVEPTEEAIVAVSRELGAIANQPTAAQPFDATAQWSLFRQHRPTRQNFQAAVCVKTDEHLNFVRRFDFERSPERGEAMLKALEMCRQDAADQRPLDWERLCEWQAVVLCTEEKPTFRRTEAYAKNGRERYSLTSGTRKQFKRLLSELTNNDCPIANAALAYSDICFFHPFEDGNARSARLALEYVLARNGLALILPDPIFRLARSPRDHHTFNLTLQCVVGKREF